jgi:hypothetical protein
MPGLRLWLSLVYARRFESLVLSDRGDAMERCIEHPGVGGDRHLLWSDYTRHLYGMNEVMIIKILMATLVFALAFALLNPAMAEDISIDFNWDAATTCKTIYLNPRMVIRNFPSEAKRVLMILTEGDREKGGQEVDLPSSGVIPAGVISTIGICNPDMYRWTAIFKSSSGSVLAETHVDRHFP